MIKIECIVNTIPFACVIEPILVLVCFLLNCKDPKQYFSWSAPTFWILSLPLCIIQSQSWDFMAKWFAHLSVTRHTCSSADLLSGKYRRAKYSMVILSLDNNTFISIKVSEHSIHVATNRTLTEFLRLPAPPPIHPPPPPPIGGSSSILCQSPFPLVSNAIWRLRHTDEGCSDIRKLCKYCQTLPWRIQLQHV